MKIYTKAGDKGETGRLDGSKISKSSLQVQACGDVDELNSWIGLLADYTINAERAPLLRSIQNQLFTIGSHIMKNPDSDKQVKLPVLKEKDILLLEKAIDQLSESLPPMKHFILPGGHKEVSFCHIARAVCRRAERSMVSLSQYMMLEDNQLIYLNRLSDYLFTLARAMGRDLNVSEIPWIADKD